MKRIRIKEFFRDFDVLRKGFVSEEQFKRVLHMSDLQLSESEINTLLSHYKIDNIFNGRVRYADFCDAIDNVFTTKNIEKDPLATVNKFTENTTLPARRRNIPLT